MELVKTAAAHSRTITTTSARLLDERRTRRSSGPRREPGVSYAVQVHPEVWAAAMELAEGRGARIEVLGPAEVLVHNHTGWRRRQLKAL